MEMQELLTGTPRPLLTDLVHQTIVPNRSATSLEAQRERPQHRSLIQRIRQENEDDAELYGPVDSALRTAAEGHANGRDFLNAYWHVSRRPGFRIHELGRVFMIRPEATAQPGGSLGRTEVDAITPTEAAGPRQVKIDELVLKEHRSLVACLRNILKFEEDVVNSETFVIWYAHASELQRVANTNQSAISCVTAENPKPNAGRTYTILKPLPSQVLCRVEVPRRALMYLLSQIPSWQVPHDIVTSIARAIEPRDHSISIELPSRSVLILASITKPC